MMVDNSPELEAHLRNCLSIWYPHCCGLLTLLLAAPNCEIQSPRMGGSYRTLHRLIRHRSTRSLAPRSKASVGVTHEVGSCCGPGSLHCLALGSPLAEGSPESIVLSQEASALDIQFPDDLANIYRKAFGQVTSC